MSNLCNHHSSQPDEFPFVNCYYNGALARCCFIYRLSELTLNRINESVIIRLKWGQTEYHGRLISVDSYMNIQLSNTEEFIDGKSTGTLGQVLIRLVNSSHVDVTQSVGIREPMQAVLAQLFQINDFNFGTKREC